MKLTIKKLIFATIAFVLLDIIYIWIRENYGLMGWVSPATLKFWSKDIALVILWIYFFFDKRKNK